MKPNPNSRLANTTPSFLLTHKTPIQVERTAPGAWVKGRWVEGLVTLINIEANVQPMRGHELLVLPEADRTKDSIKVYSVEHIDTVEDVKQEQADIVIWNGKRYKAMKSMQYQMGILNHTKTICVRLPETPDNLASV